MAMAAGAIDLVDQVLYTIAGILYRKGFSEHLSVAVAEHGHMVFFGVIDGNAHEL